MKRSEFQDKLKGLFIKDEYELLEKYVYLLSEVRELRTYKITQQERYNKMQKTLITYMDKYGSLDNKKGKKNGVHKQL